jgi:hypothetical protein
VPGPEAPDTVSKTWSGRHAFDVANTGSAVSLLTVQKTSVSGARVSKLGAALKRRSGSNARPDGSVGNTIAEHAIWIEKVAEATAVVGVEIKVARSPIGLGIGYGSLSAANGRVTVLIYGPIAIAMMITGEDDEARPS